MSMVYAAAFVATLNDTVSPWFTLKSVVNPLMLPSSLPPHCERAVPGRLFSHAIRLMLCPHELGAPGGRHAGRPSRSTPASGTTASRRCHHARRGPMARRRARTKIDPPAGPPIGTHYQRVRPGGAIPTDPRACRGPVAVRKRPGRCYKHHLWGWDLGRVDRGAPPSRSGG